MQELSLPQSTFFASFQMPCRGLGGAPSPLGQADPFTVRDGRGTADGEEDQ